MQVRESTIEQELIEKLGELKYTLRPDIRDRAALEQNFREKFEELNRVNLTDTEFKRLLEEIVTPDVFTAAHTLRNRNAFMRDDATPLNYTLVNINDWCKNTFEVAIRIKLLKDGHIDTVIGLPPNLFYSTGIPVCILVLKKCKKSDDVLFINAAEQFIKGKRQNQLSDEHIARIVRTYQQRPKKPIDRYARRVAMQEIIDNDYNLNISRYVSTAEAEQEIDLTNVHAELEAIELKINEAKKRHNAFLVELGLAPLP